MFDRFGFIALAAGAGLVTLAFGLGIALPALAAIEGNGRTAVLGPGQGFSQGLGSKQAVGFFMPQQGRCMVTLMLGEAFDEASDHAPPSAARIRLGLLPAQSAEIDSAEQQSLRITCGAKAQTVSVTATQMQAM